MSIATIKATASELASAIETCMAELREATPDRNYYAVALVVTDDFDSLAAYANTAEHLQKSGGGHPSQWYFGEWESEGMPIEFEIDEHLQEVDDFDEETPDGNSVIWFATMAEAMRIAREHGAFDWNEQTATLFCSMIDHDAAVWLEELTAKYLNPPDVYARVGPGIAAASKDWYQRKVGKPELKPALDAVLNELRESA